MSNLRRMARGLELSLLVGFSGFALGLSGVRLVEVKIDVAQLMVRIAAALLTFPDTATM